MTRRTLTVGKAHTLYRTSIPEYVFMIVVLDQPDEAPWFACQRLTAAIDIP